MDLQTEGAGPSRPRRRAKSPGLPAISEQSQNDNRPQPSSVALQWYTEYFESHTESFSQHLDGSDNQIKKSLYGTSRWLDWTVNDQSRFFAAVSRHSRLRADLIALDCSKPESEIYLYLDALDKGLNTVLTLEESEKPATSTPARKKRLREGKTLAAREVSDRWIAQEETLATQLLRDLQEEGRHAFEASTLTSRNEERKATRRRLKEEVEDRAERREKRHKATAEVEHGWTIQDWGRTLDSGKLARLNKLTQPSWSEWYSDRVRPSRHATVPPLIELEPDIMEHSQEPQERAGYTKHAKIAMDNAVLERLLAIPKRERTAEQRADLTKLANRKRNRDNVRTKRLIELGMTETDIQNEGGIDKVFLKSIGQDENAEAVVPAESGDIARSARSSPVKASRVKSLSRQASPVDTSTVSEEDAGVKHLRAIGLDEYVHAGNLDIFNFQTLAPSEDEPHLSLPILEALLSKLRIFLRHIMVTSLLIAEGEAMQLGEKSDIEARHIEDALADPEALVMDISASAVYRARSHSPTPASDADDVDASAVDFADDQLTEDEDSTIDNSAAKMDQAIDASAEAELWRSIGVSNGADLSDETESARKAYVRSIRTAHKARRARHGTQQRSVLFPATNYRRPSRLHKKRKMKSAAIIDDSDSQASDDVTADDMDLNRMLAGVDQ